MCKDLVSFIVPVYRAEEHIDTCLNSIIGQTYKNLEIILVDDGSPDKCPQICDIWAAKDERINVIHQENAGVSAARNAGLKEANGKWIVFLDADDKMAPEAIENASILAAKNMCDTVCWNCYKEFQDSISKYPAITPDNSIFQGKQKLSTLIEAIFQTRAQTLYPGHMFRAVWGKLLSAEIIKKNSIVFPVEQPLGEDAAFLANYFQVCSKVLLINQYWNFYRISSVSAVRQYRKNLEELQMLELKRICEIINTANVDTDTIMLNQYLQFDYQYIHNLYQKESDDAVIFKNMVGYIKRRKYKWKRFREYDRNKINRKSIPIAWVMTHGLVFLETLLCMLREYRHRK